MKNIEIFRGSWTVDYVRNNPDKIFVYSDNTFKQGKVGQSIIRDLPNTVGLRIKKGPNTKSAAFYTDTEFIQNRKYIFEDILKIKNYLMLGKTIVLSEQGYGKLDGLETKCPITYKYICRCLKDHFQYDNETGRTWMRIPSHSEIMNAKEFIIETLTYQKNSKILLEIGINKIFDSIKERKKIAVSHEEIFNNGDIVKFISKWGNECIICKVVTESYPVISIPKEYWSSFEGIPYNFSYEDAKTQYQFQFQYICTVDIAGTMTFSEELFTDPDPSKAPKREEPKKEKPKEKEKIKKENKEIENQVAASDVVFLFNKLQSKIDTLIEQKNSITIDSDVYDKLKEHLKDKNISIKDYIENLIKTSLS